MTAKAPKIYSQTLIDVIFRFPYTKRKYLLDEEMDTPKTVGKYLAKLEQIKVLKSTRVGRERLYLNQALMDLL